MIVTVKNNKKFTKIQIMLSSFFIAMTILSQNVMQIGMMIFNNSNLFGILFIIACLYAVYMFGIDFSKKNSCIILFILLSFFITRVFFYNSYYYVYFKYFYWYGLGGFLISQNKFEEKSLYISTTMIGLLWLTLYIKTTGLVVRDSFSFGYLLFPFVISSFLLFYVENDNKIIKIGCLVICLSLIIILFFNGSRGPLLSFIVFFLLFFMGGEKIGVKRAVVFILFILLLLNVQAVLENLQVLFPGKISFVVKSLVLEQNGVGISNGRDRIFHSLLEEYTFFDFFFGTGIGSYASAHNGGYTHNIFTCISLECGMGALVYLIYRCVCFIKNNMKKRDNINLFLFSVSIIPLCFSGLFWMSFTFWIYLFMKIEKNIEVKND